MGVVSCLEVRPVGDRRQRRSLVHGLWRRFISSPRTSTAPPNQISVEQVNATRRHLGHPGHQVLRELGPG